MTEILLKKAKTCKSSICVVNCLFNRVFFFFFCGCYQQYFYFRVQLYDNIQLSPEERAQKTVAVKSVDHSAGGTKAVMDFTASAIAVMENEGKVRVGIKRTGRMDIPVTIQ